MNPDDPRLNPFFMLDENERAGLGHACTGAECQVCSSIPTGQEGWKAGGAVERREIHKKTTWAECFDALPEAIRMPPPALSVIQQQRLAQFRDSRGYPVSQWPKALLPSATIICWKQGKVLCHQRSDSAWYGFPGGRQEIGESIVACAKREMYEETGLEVDLLGCIAIDSDPCEHGICTYKDGVVQYTNLTFLAEHVSGELRKSAESLCLRWCNPTELPEPFLPAHRWRLEQALSHQGSYVSIK